MKTTKPKIDTTPTGAEKVRARYTYYSYPLQVVTGIYHCIAELLGVSEAAMQKTFTTIAAEYITSQRPGDYLEGIDIMHLPRYRDGQSDVKINLTFIRPDFPHGWRYTGQIRASGALLTHEKICNLVDHLLAVIYARAAFTELGVTTQHRQINDKQLDTETNHVSDDELANLMTMVLGTHSVVQLQLLRVVMKSINRQTTAFRQATGAGRVDWYLV